MINLSMNIALLVSIINTYLRDKYDDLLNLCEEEDINYNDLLAILCKNNYIYDESINQIKLK